MALKFHPDKNRAPGADDAFKTVSRAFTVLSDVDKRAAYDRFGVGAIDRNSGSTGGGFAGHHFGGMNFHRPFASSAAFGEDLSPEDIFNLFFQSAFSGNHHFQTGNPFVFQSFGQSGFFGGEGYHRGHRPRRPAPQQRPSTATSRAEQERQEFIARIVQFLPLIILFVVSIFSSWLFPSGSDASTTTLQTFRDIDHLVSLDAQPSFPFSRFTHPNSFPYYASKAYNTHFASTSKKLSEELYRYEAVIEKAVIKRLQDQCKQAQRDHQQAIRRAKDDPAEQERLRLNKESPPCAKLRSIGYKIN